MIFGSKKQLLIFFVLCYNFAISQQPVTVNSALCNTTVLNSGLWSVSANQAGLANLNGTGGGVYIENRFLIKELNTKAIVAGMHTRSGTFGLFYTSFGYTKYSENKVALAYAKSLTKYLSAGIQLDYLYFRTDEYKKNKNVAIAEIGLQAQPLQNLMIGAHIYNPVNFAKNNTENTDIPVVFSLGIGMRFENIVFITLETQKNIENKPIFKTGFEINATDNLVARASIQAKPVSYSFGIGYLFKGFSVDMAFNKHYTLGYTPGFSVHYIFNTKNKN